MLPTPYTVNCAPEIRTQTAPTPSSSSFIPYDPPISFFITLNGRGFLGPALSAASSSSCTGVTRKQGPLSGPGPGRASLGGEGLRGTHLRSLH